MNNEAIALFKQRYDAIKKKNIIIINLFLMVTLLYS